MNKLKILGNNDLTNQLISYFKTISFNDYEHSKNINIKNYEDEILILSKKDSKKINLSNSKNNIILKDISTLVKIYDFIGRSRPHSFIYFLKNSNKFKKTYESYIKDRYINSKKEIKRYDILCMLQHPKYKAHTYDLSKELEKKYTTLNILNNLKDNKFQNSAVLNEENSSYEVFKNRVNSIPAKVCIGPYEHLEGGDIKVNFLHHSNTKPYSKEKYFNEFNDANYHIVTTRTQLRLIKNIMESKKEDLKHDICLIPGGYPKLDKLKKDLVHLKNTKDSICYAPTLIMHNEDFTKGLSLQNGDEIISLLLNKFKNYNVIFRPHPHIKLYGYKDAGLSYIDNIIDKYKNNPRFIYDETDYYLETFARSEIMIGDFSSILQTFPFATSCPIIALSNDDFIDHYKNVFDEDDIRKECGEVITSLSQLEETIKRVLSNKNEFKKKIKEYTKKEVFNLENSVKYIVDNFDYIINQKNNKDWTYIEKR